MDKFTLYDDSKYENHATNELHLEGSSSEGLEEAVKQYIKDCVALKFPTSDAKLKETDIRAAFLAGSEWKKEELIAKACLYMFENLHGETLTLRKIDDFKKAMKDEL